MDLTVAYTDQGSVVLKQGGLKNMSLVKCAFYLPLLHQNVLVEH